MEVTEQHGFVLRPRVHFGKNCGCAASSTRRPLTIWTLTDLEKGYNIPLESSRRSICRNLLKLRSRGGDSVSRFDRCFELLQKPDNQERHKNAGDQSQVGMGEDFLAETSFQIRQVS